MAEVPEYEPDPRTLWGQLRRAHALWKNGQSEELGALLAEFARGDCFDGDPETLSQVGVRPDLVVEVRAGAREPGTVQVGLNGQTLSMAGSVEVHACPRQLGFFIIGQRKDGPPLVLCVSPEPVDAQTVAYAQQQARKESPS